MEHETNDQRYWRLVWTHDAAFRAWIRNLVACLSAAGALEYAYSLGRNSCGCDQGPLGDEWIPGQGVSPEEIAGNWWTHEGHEYQPAVFGLDGERCAACGNPRWWYLHDGEYIAQCRGADPGERERYPYTAYELGLIEEP